MTAIFQAIVPIAMLGFVLSSMLGMGLGLSVSEILAPLKNARLIIVALFASFVLLPAAAIGLGRLIRLEEPFAIGLLLLASAAGAPFIPKLAQLARGNVAFGVGVMVLLMVVTIAYLPLALPILLTGVKVDPWAIAKSLLLMMLLPLAIGLVGRAQLPELAAKVKPLLDRLSSLSLAVLMVAITGANLKNVISVFGTGGILAGLLADRDRLWRRLAPGRAGPRNPERDGTRDGATKHRRGAPGGQRLRRSQGCGDGGRRGDRGTVRPHAHARALSKGRGSGLRDSVRKMDGAGRDAPQKFTAADSWKLPPWKVDRASNSCR